jgi:hypothetical protein
MRPVTDNEIRDALNHPAAPSEPQTYLI